MNDISTLELPCPPAEGDTDAYSDALVFLAADSSVEEAVSLSLVYDCRDDSGRKDGGREDSGRVWRKRIELGCHARAKLVLRYEMAPDAVGGNPAGTTDAGGDGSAPIFRTALDIHLAKGARLELFVISALPRTVRHEVADTAVLDDKAFLYWTEAGFDEGDGSYESHVDLGGKNSELDFAGAYGASGRTDRIHTLNERHGAPGARSRAVMKSALRDSAHLTFRGLIHVEPGAPGTDAYLSNRNLILDDGARAESLPQLRIETDDVACSHGSATGGPREDEMFYLMSRGLDRDGARRLLVLGHLGSVLDRAPPELAGELEGLAARALGGDVGAELTSGAVP